MSAKKTIFLTLLILFLSGILGAGAFVYSGFYDIAARTPHFQPVQELLLWVKNRSIKYHAQDLRAPNLNRPELVKRGLSLYLDNCIDCHGAPGASRSRLGIGLNPNPPPLVQTAEQWTPAQIAWITANGLKMAGMPAFGLGEEPGDLWALTAFVIRLNSLSPAEFRDMLAVYRQELPEGVVPWLPENANWTTLRSRGDKERGKSLLREYGCLSCHAVPGVAGSQGVSGPPLNQWAKRHYIAGKMVNHPQNLVAWIMNPQEIEAGTAMPDLGVSEEDAWDMSRYLYSIGADREQDEISDVKASEGN